MTDQPMRSTAIDRDEIDPILGRLVNLRAQANAGDAGGRELRAASGS